jgi:hypothetical protein
MGVVSESLGGRFRVSFSLDDRDPVAAFFLASAIDRGYPELRSENWTTSVRSLEAVGKPIIRSASSHSETVVVEEPRVLLIVSLGESFVYAQAAAADATTAEAALAGVRELLPPPEPSARQEVPVMFWTYSAQGPLPSMRKISVPEWSEIRGNYSESTQAALDGLMQGFRPSHGGQLVLWHGGVGTRRSPWGRSRGSGGTGRSTTSSIRNVLRGARRLPDERADAIRRPRLPRRDDDGLASRRVLEPRDGARPCRLRRG